MAKDLMVEMGINSKGFDKSLENSTKQINSFQAKMNGLASGFGSFIGVAAKFGGALGVGVTVGEALSKTLNSNQETADRWKNTIEASKSSIDAFFRSLATGDWKAFDDGLGSTFEKFKKLSETLDRLGDKKLSLSFIKEKDLTNIEEFEASAKDTNLTLKERKNAVAGMKAAVDKLSQSTQSTINDTQAAIQQMYKAQYGLSFDEKDITDFLENTNFGGTLRKEVDEYTKTLKELEQNKYRFTQTPYGTQRVENTGVKEQIKAFKEQNVYLEKQRILLNETDEKRQNTVNLLRENLQMEKEIYTLKKRTDEASRNVNSGKVEQPLTVGSRKAIEKELADITKIIENTDAANLPVDLLLKKESLRKQLDEISQNEKITVAMKTFEAKGGGSELIDTPSTIPNVSITHKGFDIDKENENLKSYVDKLNEVKESVVSTEQAMSSLGSGMYDLGGAIGGNAGKWLQWGGQLSGAISTALPQLAALTTAQSKTAITGVASSVAGIPIAGAVMAVGAVASLIAAFSSMPQFANGGVVPGTSFSGDKVVARVNSGEMILNSAQQSRLWNTINGGGVSGGSNEVFLRVRGTDLEGVLRNVSFKNSRR